MKNYILTLIIALCATISYSQDIAPMFDSQTGTMESYELQGAYLEFFVPILYQENEAFYCPRTDMYIIPLANDQVNELSNLPTERIVWYGEAVNRYILTDGLHDIAIMVRVDDNLYKVNFL